MVWVVFGGRAPLLSDQRSKRTRESTLPCRMVFRPDRAGLYKNPLRPEDDNAVAHKSIEHTMNVDLASAKGKEAS